VIGFGDGPAQTFSHLGPIIRLAPDGFFDARDGNTYAAVTHLSYLDPPGYTWFDLDIDLAAHRYSAWAWHDGGGPGGEIARDYAFRTEQRALARIDDLGTFIDAAAGSMWICDLRITPRTCVRSFGPGSWKATSFPPQAGSFRIDVDAQPLDTDLDAVVGLARTTPARFTDLAAIVRFNPGGHLDVRNGGAYGADVDLAYQVGQTYHLTFDVDLRAHRYSVDVRGPGMANAVRIATDYAFRTEQASVTTLGVLGQYVDNPDGDVIVCDLTLSY
jgi:hypothetical protein